MSQSASFYSIADKDFKIIQQSEDSELDIAPYVTSYCTLDDSYMALEFTLVTNQTEDAIIILEEIFNPAASFGGSDFSGIDIDSIDPIAFETMIMNDASVYYLSPETIDSIVVLLDQISTDDILSNYNATALNENDIYPGKWHNDESAGLLYNGSHLQKSYNELKSFFQIAADKKDYILTFLQG
ncbi:MAG: DUF1877 family protein [Bacteroidota bacterium]